MRWGAGGGEGSRGRGSGGRGGGAGGGGGGGGGFIQESDVKSWIPYLIIVVFAGKQQTMSKPVELGEDEEVSFNVGMLSGNNFSTPTTEASPAKKFTFRRLTEQQRISLRMAVDPSPTSSLSLPSLQTPTNEAGRSFAMLCWSDAPTLLKLSC